MIFYAQLFCITSPNDPGMIALIDDSRFTVDDAMELMKKKFKEYAIEQKFDTGGQIMVDAVRTKFPSLEKAIAQMKADGVPLDCLTPQPDPSKGIMLFSPLLGKLFN